MIRLCHFQTAYLIQNQFSCILFLELIPLKGWCTAFEVEHISCNLPKGNFWLQRQRERRKKGRESESFEIAEVEVEADAAVDVADVVVVEADVEAVLG